MMKLMNFEHYNCLAKSHRTSKSLIIWCILINCFDFVFLCVGTSSEWGDCQESEAPGKHGGELPREVSEI